MERTSLGRRATLALRLLSSGSPQVNTSSEHSQWDWPGRVISPGEK